MRRFGLRLMLTVLALAAIVAGSGSSYLLWNRLAQPVWRMVIRQADGNLLLSDGTTTRPLTTRADGKTLVYLHPTPSPDGRSIAVVTIRTGSTPIGTVALRQQAEASAALQVLGLDGSVTTLFSEPQQSPFYLSWSPDSRKIAFLVGTAFGMALHAAAIDGSTGARQIATGQPSYFSWSPDSARLLLHIGGASPNGTLQIYDWGSESPQQIAAEPLQFQAPRWLADGERALVVVRDNNEAALAAIDADGTIVQRFSNVDPTTLFVLAPNSQRVAYVPLGSELAGQLHVLQADGSDDRVIGERVITCFWSPDGASLAFLSVAGTGTLRWNVLTVADGALKSFEPFTPSLDFLNVLPFFDQYAQSHRLWDQTGTHLIYATQDGVYTLDVQSSSTTRVGDGVLGFWLE